MKKYNLNYYIKQIENSKKTRISLEDLYKILGKEDNEEINKFKTYGYSEFYEIVKELERANIIYSKSNTMNANPKPLNRIYYVTKEEKPTLTKDDKVFVHQLHGAIYKKSYLRNKELLDNHKKLLEGIDRVLKNKKNFEISSVRERSYELYSDEKILEKFNVLGRAKLEATDILCLKNPQPLLAYTLPSFYQKNTRTILIIENLDTYWTFHRILNENKDFLSIDMLIFGKGYGTTDKKYDFSLYDITPTDRILYFGDLDAEGLRIYQIFKNNTPIFNISLCFDLYRELLKKGEERGFGIMPTQNQPNITTLEKELNGFTKQEKEKIKEVIERRLFMPQEALNRSMVLREGSTWKLENY